MQLSFPFMRAKIEVPDILNNLDLFAHSLEVTLKEQIHHHGLEWHTIAVDKPTKIDIFHQDVDWLTKYTKDNRTDIVMRAGQVAAGMLAEKIQAARRFVVVAASHLTCEYRPHPERDSFRLSIELVA